MSDSLRGSRDLPPDQQSIRAKCLHPSGRFVPFERSEIEQSIPGRFETIVCMYPDRLAVKMRNRALSYDSLNRAANRVARALRDQCGDTTQPVILLAGHGAGAIISCLGILKAGKVLVAVDTSSPLERIAYMVEDSQAHVILSDTTHLSMARTLAKSERQVLDAEALHGEVAEDNLGLHIDPDAPAQIIYTSGSMGRPKGIIRNHRRVLHNVMLEINAAHICPKDRLLASLNLSFGAGLKDICKGLLSGAALFPFDMKKDALSNLAAFLAREEITFYTSTPSAFRHVADELSENSKFPAVRLVQLTAELLSKREVDLYKRHFTRDCILMHNLSTTETGTLSYYFADHDTEVNGPIVPVGYPVEDKEIFLLDESGNRAAIGDVGEIAVKSRYLSSEYWRNPELTKAKFLSDPGGGDKRIYLTGDLGRMLPDGCLVYLGRKDLEVKIRGFKVALPEIEIALTEHAAVREAAVIPWDNEALGKYLAAYIVPGKRPLPTANDILSLLRKKFPDYMLPSAFVFLESLPRSNGKVDRQALPPPDWMRSGLEQPYAPATNDVERQLIKIWEEVLDRRPIGIHDKFLDLGGHSLAATRVTSQVLREFRLELPLQALFQSPTVAQMAAVIIVHQAAKPDPRLVGSLLVELEGLSDDEARRLLANEKKAN